MNLIRFTSPMWNSLCDYLFHDENDPREQFVFALARAYRLLNDKILFLVTELLLPDNEFLECQSTSMIKPKKEFVKLAYTIARDNQLVVVDIHKHPRGVPGRFSSTDTEDDKVNGPGIHQSVGTSLLSIVFDYECKEFESRFYHPEKDCFIEVPVIQIIGSRTWTFTGKNDISILDRSRFDRQYLIPGWTQNQLSNARILVVGAGGTGFPLTKVIAAMGMGTKPYGQITVLDCDKIENSNRSRLLDVTAKDNGKKKVKVIQDHIKRCYPESYIQGISVNILEENALEPYADHSIIIGAVDNISARFRLNSFAMQMGSILIDMGTEIFPIDDLTYEAGGQVEIVYPGESGCMMCREAFKDEKALINDLYPEDRQAAELAGYVSGTSASPAPMVIDLNMTIVSITARQVRRMLCGDSFLGREIIVYDALKESTVSVSTPKKADCLHCGLFGTNNFWHRRNYESMMERVPVVT